MMSKHDTVGPLVLASPCAAGPPLSSGPHSVRDRRGSLTKAEL